MSPGILTLAALAFALGTEPSDVVPLNGRTISIPILIKEGQRDKIRELLLFASTDQGATWNQVAVATPDKNAFVYYAGSDGLYWFNFLVVDSKGNRDADISRTSPRQKVLVDTVKPTVRITSAERQGEDIVVGWEIRELNPALNTLKLEYRPADAPEWAWTAANAEPALTGQARFRVTTPNAIAVRVQMADLAGNVGSGQADLAAKVTSSAPTSAAVPPAVQANPNNANPNANSQSTFAATMVNSVPAATPVNPPATNVPLVTAPERTPPLQPTPLTQVELRNSADRTYTAVTQPGTLEGANRSSVPPGNYATVDPAASGTRWPVTALVPLQVTNSPQVSLDYELKKVGPSGVGSVVLYLTDDDGRTWRRYADDKDLTSPITASLPGEGIFGLRLVVTSRAGLGRKAPQPGDLPQMRIEVDTTPPTVKLFPPQADANRRDALVLTWTAGDRNLAANPITLQWAERPDSPWHTIAPDLPNSGRYIWQLSPNLPYSVYLRITARDTAGNTGMDETPEAVLVDLHEPDGQLLGITGTGRHP